MYQLLAQGKHPLYEEGDSYNNYLQKLTKLIEKPTKWHVPSHFSHLAKDFFLKLCVYPPSERYDAKAALKHPWITRKLNAEIPLTSK